MRISSPVLAKRSAQIPHTRSPWRSRPTQCALARSPRRSGCAMNPRSTLLSQPQPEIERVSGVATNVLPFDVRNLAPDTREALAWRVHELTDFALPSLSAWNYDLCRVHARGWVEDFYDPLTGSDRQRTVYD